MTDFTSNADTIAESISAVYERKSNKVTSITSNSTNTQYPTAKAVYDYIDSVINEYGDWIIWGGLYE